MLAKVKSPFRAKPGVAAHQLVCAVPFTYAAWVGARVWLYDAGIAAMDGATYVERLYGAHDASWSLCRFMIGFQIYDLLATGLEPSLRSRFFPDSSAASHRTAARSKIAQYYTRATAAKALELYAADYDAFDLPRPDVDALPP